MAKLNWYFKFGAILPKSFVIAVSEEIFFSVFDILSFFIIYKIALFVFNLIFAEKVKLRPVGSDFFEFFSRTVECGNTSVDIGFALMGARPEQFFKPNWCAARNFHCFWYYDSDVLNDYLQFRTETWESRSSKCGT